METAVALQRDQKADLDERPGHCRLAQAIGT
jgi:hypothetical protein